MILVSFDLGTTLSQKLTTPSRAVHIEAIRPHLYKSLAPAGSFRMRVLDINQKLVAESSTLTSADISSANYYHGYIKFPVRCTLSPSTTYFIQLAATGYSATETEYISWLNDYDLKKYDSAWEGIDSPFDYEIWEYKTKRRGDY